MLGRQTPWPGSSRGTHDSTIRPCISAASENAWKPTHGACAFVSDSFLGALRPQGHRRGRRWQDVLPSSGEVVPRCVSAACLVCPVIKDGHGLSLALAVVNNATFYQGGCSDYVAGTQTQGGEGPLAAYLIAGLRR